MSLIKTLAKVAVGVAVAKGASAMMHRQGSAESAEGGGLGGLLGRMTGGLGAGSGSPIGGTSSPAGGLQDMLGNLLGGAGAATGQANLGGLGGMLEQLGGGQAGLGGLLGGLAGAAGASGAVGAMPQSTQAQTASFGQVLNSAFDQTPEPFIEPSADQEAAAALMLRAMIQAAKCDGQLDDAEQQKLVGQMGGDVDAEEAAFLRAEMAKPVDVQALINDTPHGLGPQIYAMSLLAINLDNQTEAKYLHQLAQGYGLDAAAVNDIHAQLGVPSLYT